MLAVAFIGLIANFISVFLVEKDSYVTLQAELNKCCDKNIFLVQD